MASLKKNIIYSVAYQILIIFLPLITAPYVSRVLGADGIGEYSYTQSVVYYFSLIAMLGISQYGNRAIAEVGKNKEERSKRFINIYAIQIITHTFIIIAYILYLLLIEKGSSTLATIQAIALLSSALDISWFFFGMEKFDITVTRNSIIKIATVILIFLLVKDKGDLWKYTLILLGGTFFSQVYLWMYMKKYTVFFRPDFVKIKQQIRPILILFIPVLAYSIYKVMDKIMLGTMTGSYEQVGYYENAYKINNIPIGLITAIGNVMLPRMTSIISEGNEELTKKYINNSFALVNVVAASLVFGIAGISKNFVYVYYGEDYMPCSELMVCLNWTVFFIAWANIMRTQYLIPKKMDKIYVGSTLTGAVVNLVLNVILINYFQAMGAAIGTFFAELSVMLVQLIAIRKSLPVWKEILMSTPYYILGAIMMHVLKIMESYLEFGLWTLILQVLTGVIIFTVGSVLISLTRKDKIYYIIGDFIRKKRK